MSLFLSKQFLELLYCKPYFTSKCIWNDESIVLVEIDEFLRKKMLNSVKFIFIKTLQMNWGEDVSYYSKSTSQTTVFNNNPSIWLIKDKYQQSFDFKLEFVLANQALRYINLIDCSKGSVGDIHAKIIKMAKEEITVPFPNCINKCISLFRINVTLLILS